MLRCFRECSCLALCRASTETAKACAAARLARAARMGQTLEVVFCAIYGIATARMRFRCKPILGGAAQSPEDFIGANPYFDLDAGKPR